MEKNDDMATAKRGDRLETPNSLGYRTGMSASDVIARKLARVYDISRDLPREFDAALRSIDQKIDQRA